MSMQAAQFHSLKWQRVRGMAILQCSMSLCWLNLLSIGVICGRLGIPVFLHTERHLFYLSIGVICAHPLDTCLCMTWQPAVTKAESTCRGLSCSGFARVAMLARIICLQAIAICRRQFAGYFPEIAGTDGCGWPCRLGKRKEREGSRMAAPPGHAHSTQRVRVIACPDVAP